MAPGIQSQHSSTRLSLAVAHFAQARLRLDGLLVSLSLAGVQLFTACKVLALGIACDRRAGRRQRRRRTAGSRVRLREVGLINNGDPRVGLSCRSLPHNTAIKRMFRD